MKTIPLTQGKVALVDDRHYDYLMQWKWYFDVYARRGRKKSDAPGPHNIYMHRVVAERAGMEIEGLEVDHDDQNRLNNQLANLRVATTAQNGGNRPKCGANTSGFKGVSWFKRDKKWESSIRVNRKTIHFRLFTNVFDAAAAYVEASIKYQGEFSPYTADDLLLYRIERLTRWT